MVERSWKVRDPKGRRQADMEAELEGRKEPKLDEPVRILPPPFHSFGKPVEQMLAEDMAYYEVPFFPARP